MANLDNIQLEGGIGTTLFLLPFLALLIYLTIYRMWFSPSRRVIVVISPMSSCWA